MISAVVPVFNAERTLTRAVDSLLLQPEIDEIFLVEDGSVDGSFQLCKEIAERHSHIKVLQHPGGSNRGAPESRNLGLRLSKNAWIQFMDADDELLPGKISNQLALITGEEDLIVGQFLYIRQDGSSSPFVAMKDVWSGLIATRLGYTSSNLWRKSAVVQAGEWDTSLINIQEYNLIFSMLKLGARVKFSDHALTKIYYQADSIGNSPQNRREKWDHYFTFRKKIRTYLIETSQFTLRRRHYFNSTTGLMLRYHQPDFKVNLDKTYFLFYSLLRTVRKNLHKIKVGIFGGIFVHFVTYLI